jgi:hypothetical protein
VKFDWKVAMAVESNKCKNIETPYISAVAHVSDSTGKIVAHAFDMSFSEFNVRFFLVSYEPKKPELSSLSSPIISLVIVFIIHKIELRQTHENSCGDAGNFVKTKFLHVFFLFFLFLFFF